MSGWPARPGALSLSLCLHSPSSPSLLLPLSFSLPLPILLLFSGTEEGDREEEQANRQDRHDLYESGLGYLMPIS